MGTVLRPWLKAEAQNDYIVRHQIRGLKADSHYRYRLEFGRDEEHTEEGTGSLVSHAAGRGVYFPTAVPIIQLHELGCIHGWLCQSQALRGR